MKMLVDRSRFFKWSDFVHKSPGSKLSTLFTTFIKGLLRPLRLAFIYLILCLAVQVSAQTDMTGSKSPPERNSYSAPIYSTSRCNKSCTSQEDVPCTIRVLHSYCMMTRKEHADFPNKPRELNISHNVVNNRRVFNITWKAPYDYSYRVLEGFELLLDKKSHNIFSGMPECIFFNLSTVNWTAVTNIHSVVFFYDCWQESIHTDMKIKLTLFSYPKPLEQAPYESKTLNVTGIPLYNWNPSINFNLTNHGVSVVVKGAHPEAAYHKLCISRSNTNMFSCLGNVTYIPSKDKIVRFDVTGLPQNVNLTIYVQPYDEANNKLDEWVYSSKKIVIPPSPPDPSTTVISEAVTQVSTSTEPPGPWWVVYVVAGLVLVLVLGAAMLIVHAGIHRGFFGRLKVFHCDNCMVPGSGSPIKILHLYVPENPEFDNFVRRHIAFLKVCANIKTVEASQIWNQDFQLESVFASHRVLIYISPSLAQALCDEGSRSALPHSYLTVTRLVLRSLQQNASAQHRNDSRNLPILVVSGCFPSDDGDEVRLRNLRVVPCHWVSYQYASSADLKHPADLLHDIGSQQRCTCFDPLRSECWRSKPEATSLRHALRDLRAAFEHHTTRVMIRENDQLVHLSDVTHSESLSLDANPALQSVDQATTQMLTSYADPYFDQVPQQPDSGHSSSFTGMGSDPDLSRNSPGERAGRSRAEDASETETDSLICTDPDHDTQSLRRSLPFFAPDDYTSIDGSQSNIDNILMNLNRKSEVDWSQDRYSRDFI